MCNITNSDPKFDKIVLNALKYFNNVKCQDLIKKKYLTIEERKLPL